MRFAIVSRLPVRSDIHSVRPAARRAIASVALLTRRRRASTRATCATAKTASELVDLVADRAPDHRQYLAAPARGPRRPPRCTSSRSTAVTASAASARRCSWDPDLHGDDRPASPVHGRLHAVEQPPDRGDVPIDPVEEPIDRTARDVPPGRLGDLPWDVAFCSDLNDKINLRRC